MKVAWISSWQKRCGIADYSKVLWPHVSAGCTEAQLFELDDLSAIPKISKDLHAFKPDLVHIQHEYGLWGGKNPPFYRFPSFIWALRRSPRLTRARWVATAHTVLPPEYQFPVSGRGASAPLRAALNVFALPTLRNFWGPKTWGRMDGVIAHSRWQRPWILAASAPRCEVIPHFVPEGRGVSGTVERGGGESRFPPEWRKIDQFKKRVLVFGFFSPEKGQDLMIEAWQRISAEHSDALLILAGGLRRPEDQRYMDACLARIRASRLDDRILITGYVDARWMDDLYRSATLVVAPFRSTTGSGSLAHALGQGAAILASDLPINREIAEREAGSLAFFETEDAAGLTRECLRLMGDEDARRVLSSSARAYASQCRPAKVAERHLAFYRELLNP